jgi:hypothetical protein
VCMCRWCRPTTLLAVNHDDVATNGSRARPGRSSAMPDAVVPTRAGASPPVSHTWPSKSIFDAEPCLVLVSESERESGWAAKLYFCVLRLGCKLQLTRAHVDYDV